MTRTFSLATRALRTLSGSWAALACATAVLAVAMLTPACGKDDSKAGFFDEEGVWLLHSYQLDPSFDIEPPGADRGFWMRFAPESPGRGVVATASCGLSKDPEKNRHDVRYSNCGDRASADSRVYKCGCYNYTFEGNKMVWERFDALYDQSNDDSSKSEDQPADAEKPKAGAAKKLTTTKISAHESKKDSYIFRGLPNFKNEDEDIENRDGVFQSNGINSRHEFRRFKTGPFDETGCNKACGIKGKKGKKDDDASGDDEEKDEASEDEEKDGGDEEKDEGDEEKDEGDEEKDEGDEEKDEGDGDKDGGDEEKDEGDEEKDEGDEEKDEGDEEKEEGDEEKDGGDEEKDDE